MTEQNKLDTLKALIEEYLQYTSNRGWTGVNIGITVTWYKEVERTEYDGTKVRWPQSESREFPLSSIDERIKSYRNKINYAKSKKDAV